MMEQNEGSGFTLRLQLTVRSFIRVADVRIVSQPWNAVQLFVARLLTVFKACTDKDEAIIVEAVLCFIFRLMLYTICILCDYHYQVAFILLLFHINLLCKTLTWCRWFPAREALWAAIPEWTVRYK